MLEQLIYYIGRGTWTGSGLATVAVAATAPDGHGWIRVSVALCGLIAILMSLTLGGLLKHLASHSVDRESLFDELASYTRAERCDDRYTNVCEKLDDIKDMLKRKDVL